VIRCAPQRVGAATASVLVIVVSRPEVGSLTTIVNIVTPRLPDAIPDDDWFRTPPRRLMMLQRNGLDRAVGRLERIVDDRQFGAVRRPTAILSILSRSEYWLTFPGLSLYGQDFRLGCDNTESYCLTNSPQAFRTQL
jgi:hypothetical protein